MKIKFLIGALLIHSFTLGMYIGTTTTWKDCHAAYAKYLIEK